jgi:hypothetical protein
MTAMKNAVRKRHILKKKCEDCDTIRKYEDCEVGCSLIEKRKDKR